MFSPEFAHEEMVMTDTRPQLVSEASTSRIVALIAAGLLIFVGTVFQLGRLGYGVLCADSVWVLQMIGTNLWDLLAVRLDAPSIGQIVEFWPLALVGMGLTILLALKPENRVGARCGSRGGRKPRA
jgi:phosphotransferase system  glucose/maltose/N-acetylglucosamine-specific IIC component